MKEGSGRDLERGEWEYVNAVRLDFPVDDFSDQRGRTRAEGSGAFSKIPVRTYK